jgi:excisionase family DNA binding protein
MGKQIGIEELARHLELAVSTLRKWVMLKKIPFEKIGEAVRFDLDKINPWLEEHTVYPERELKPRELEKERRKYAEGKGRQGKAEPELFPPDGREGT